MLWRTKQGRSLSPRLQHVNLHHKGLANKPALPHSAKILLNNEFYVPTACPYHLNLPACTCHSRPLSPSV